MKYFYVKGNNATGPNPTGTWINLNHLVSIVIQEKHATVVMLGGRIVELEDSEDIDRIKSLVVEEDTLAPGVPRKKPKGLVKGN